MKVSEFVKLVEEAAWKGAESYVHSYWSNYNTAAVAREELRKLDEVRTFEEEHQVSVTICASSSDQLSFEIALKEENPLAALHDRPYSYFFCYLGRKKVNGTFAAVKIKDIHEAFLDEDVRAFLEAYYESTCRALAFKVEQAVSVYETLRKYNISSNDMRVIAEAYQKSEKLHEYLGFRKISGAKWFEGDIFDPAWKKKVLAPAAKVLGVSVEPFLSEEK